MKIAMCEWPARKGGKFDGPVLEEFEDGSILISVRSEVPRWIEGTKLRVNREHILGYAEQSVMSPEDVRKARGK
jgi:hypothetical protein